MTNAPPVTAGAPRGVGQRAGLDVEQIVAAARSLPPGEVTMQSVATRLGVDRKALNHHVRGLEGLLELVAHDAFAENFDVVGLTEAPTWQEACRAYAVAFTRGLTAIGVLAESLKTRGPAMTGIIAPTETLLERLAEAGFGEEEAAQTLMLLTFIFTGFVSNAALTRQVGEHVGLVQLRAAREEAGGDRFERVTRMADPSIDTSGERLFEAGMVLFLEGAEALRRRSTP